MKRGSNDPGKTISLGLTWDGSRVFPGELPPEVRSFLARSQWPVLLNPEATEFDRLMDASIVREIRIGWVPSLSGGEVCSSPKMLDRRVPFKLIWRRSLRDYVLTVYRPVLIKKSAADVT